MQHIINQLILIAGSWNATGQTDKHLESQFDYWLGQLAKVAKTGREEALNLLVEHLGGEAA